MSFIISLYNKLRGINNQEKNVNVRECSFDLSQYQKELQQSHMISISSHILDQLHSLELLNHFGELLQQHECFFNQLISQYSLDLWILHSVYAVLCQNTSEINTKNMFTDKNLCCAILLVWDYLEDEYHIEKDVIKYFGKLLYPSHTLSSYERKKKLYTLKSHYLCMNVGFQLMLPTTIILPFQQLIESTLSLQTRSSSEMISLSLSIFT